MPTLLLSAVLLLTGLRPADVQADPREQLSTAIAHGIKLLEAGDYAGFLRDFVSPDEAKEIFGQEPGGLSNPKLVQKFAEQKGPQLLVALRDAQKASPTFEDNGRLAAYPLKTPIGGRKALTFVKVGKLWYIRN